MTCTRDANGWRIPKVGTTSRSVYDLLVCEERPTPKEISGILGLSYNHVGNIIWRLRNAAKIKELPHANASRNV